MGTEGAKHWPRRIICLTEETTETLYLLGEQDRIVGVSGYTARPPEARRKPKVSAFISAKFDKILQLQPDLVFAFSDLQADITSELVRRGVTVMHFNQRSIAEIFDMIEAVARLVGVEEKGRKLAAELHQGLHDIQEAAQKFTRRPKVFFEEWHDPLISGIRWVDELVEIAGGEPVFPELRQHQGAKDRILDPAQVIVANPDVIIASWCGRKVNPQWIRSRPGWDAITAVKRGHIFEVKSTHILQPGPASLTDGVGQLHQILAGVQ